MMHSNVVASLPMTFAANLPKLWRTFQFCGEPSCGEPSCIIIFYRLCTLDNLEYVTWVTHLRKILLDHELDYLWTCESISLRQYKDIEHHILERYKSSFLSQIQNGQNNPELRTYQLFKSQLKCETYLAVPKYRFSL